MAENMPPFEMDPTTLESKGLWDYDGKMLGISTTAELIRHQADPVDGDAGAALQAADEAS